MSDRRKTDDLEHSVWIITCINERLGSARLGLTFSVLLLSVIRNRGIVIELYTLTSGSEQRKILCVEDPLDTVQPRFDEPASVDDLSGFGIGTVHVVDEAEHELIDTECFPHDVTRDVAELDELHVTLRELPIFPRRPL